jgi:hypothetical protein
MYIHMPRSRPFRLPANLAAVHEGDAFLKWSADVDDAVAALEDLRGRRRVNDRIVWDLEKGKGKYRRVLCSKE